MKRERKHFTEDLRHSWMKVRSQIKWHKSCYTSTTSKKNLSHLKNEQEITEVEGESSSASEIQTRRSSVIDFGLEEMYILPENLSWERQELD